MSTPTATKLSQKPGCSHAQGSVISTAPSTTSHCTGQGQWRAPARSHSPRASMSTVRWAGTPQPAASA